MQTLRVMATYNRWANERVFVRCQEVEAELPGEVAKAIRETLAHSLLVEEVYLAVLRGDELRQLRAEYEGKGLAWQAERLGPISDGYDTMLAEADEPFLTGEFSLPWFTAPMSRREGVLQAFLHANHHRSQVFSILGERGIEVPDLDYLQMVQPG